MVLIIVKYTPFLSESAKAIITLLRAKRPEFIETLSLNLSPVTPDFFILSDPAKSTKLILKLTFSFVDLFIFSIKTVKIAWDLDETSFE